MNVQKNQTPKKASYGEARNETQAETRPKSEESAIEATSENAGGNGSEAKQRRRKSRAEEDARAVKASKGKAREKIGAQIKALEKLEALI